MGGIGGLTVVGQVLGTLSHSPCPQGASEWGGKQTGKSEAQGGGHVLGPELTEWWLGVSEVRQVDRSQVQWSL